MAETLVEVNRHSSAPYGDGRNIEVVRGASVIYLNDKEAVKLVLALFPPDTQSPSISHSSDYNHPQVDTGLGFSCDAEILDVVRAFNLSGMVTRFSCQDHYHNSPEDMRPSIALAFVNFTHPNLHILMDFCSHINATLCKGGGHTLTIDFKKHHTTASLFFPKSLHRALMQALQSIPDALKERIHN